MKHAMVVLLLIPSLSYAQLSRSDNLWLPLQPLIGKWTGTGEAPEGKGNYERSYTFVLNKKFIEVRNKSTYPPTKENPKGYIHEDHGYISYDKSMKKFVYRQFHSEGFVNEYVTESISTDGKKIVFITESIENIPAGWRGRETYTLNGTSFTEDFDLAEPNKDFEAYSKASFVKSK